MNARSIQNTTASVLSLAIIALVVGWVPVASAQITLDDMPQAGSNDRFLDDDIPEFKHPSLSINGFDAGPSKGFGLKQILEKNYESTDQSVEMLYEELEILASANISSASNRNNVIRNTQRMQARAFIALATYVMKRNGETDDLTFPDGVSSVDEASDRLQAALTNTDAWKVEKDWNDDGIKWTVAVGNMARAMDLYLALENAYCHYGNMGHTLSQNECSGASHDRLLSETEKNNVFSHFSSQIQTLNHSKYWGYDGLPVDRFTAEAGNASLKIMTAVGYASLTNQKNPDESFGWVGRAMDKNFGKSNGNRLRYWGYQTGDGKRFWAEGPYYLDVALPDVIPFWHAIRASEMLDYEFSSINASDPFNTSLNTTPLEWLADVVTPQGRTPPLDDGNKHKIEPTTMLRWSDSYGAPSVGKKFAWIAEKLASSSNEPRFGANPSTIPVEIAIPDIEGEGTPPSETIGNTSKDQTGNSGEQQIVVRRGTSTGACENASSPNGECHYVVLNGESQFAYERGEGHEQPDQMQLLYYVDGTSVLMDTGYDNASDLKNSTWNNYFDHNVLLGGGGVKYIDATGGLEAPFVNETETHMEINDQPAKYLYRTQSGSIDILRGSQWLPEGINLYDNSVGPARYKRDVIFIGGSDPYIIDFSRSKHWTPYDSMIEYQRNNPFALYYHFNTPNLQINDFYEVDGTEFIETSTLGESGKSAYIFPMVMEHSLKASLGDVYWLPKTAEETFGEQNISRLGINTYFLEQYMRHYTFASIIQAQDGPPSNTPKLVVGENDPVDAEERAWVWKRGSETYDVFIGREMKTNSGSVRFSIQAKSGYPDFRVELPSGKRYGFARVHKSGGEWTINSNYQVNLERAPMQASISGPSTLESGQQGTWTAGVTGGSGSTSYDWEYRPLGSYSWQDKYCTGESCSHTFYNNSDQVQNGSIRSIVTKGTETDTAQTLVFVTPSCGDNVLICPATASSAAPADSGTTSKPKYLALRSLQVKSDGPASTLTWTTTGPVPPSQFVVQSRPDSTAEWSDLETVRAADSVRADSTDKPAYQLTTEPPSAGNAAAFQIRLSYQRSDAPDRFSEVLSPTEGIASLSDTAPSSLASSAPARVHSLRAESASGGIDLTWETEQPPSRSFVVQHRADSTASWSTLGTVAAGDSTSAGSPQAVAYRFQTNKLEIGTHQFRVGWPGEAGPAPRAVGNSETSASRRYTKPVTAKIEMDEAYRLSAYPNPVRQQATVELAVQERQNVQVHLYDVLGRRVATLHDGPLPAQELERLQVNVSATGLTSGTYFLRVTGENFATTEQMTVVR